MTQHIPNEPAHPHRRYTTGDPIVDERLAGIVQPFEDGLDRRLLHELMISAYRMGQDKASTIDLKIINSAVKELRHAFKAFRPYRRIHKVAMFGSARVGNRHPAYAMAKEFGRIMAHNGWMVITGAASGIMRAGHEGAGRSASIGLNIRLPFEQGANEFIAKDDKLVTCKYFFTRKLLFIKESHATALFDGGFGTLDEGFESLTLVQTGKSDPRPIVFVESAGRNFWRPLLRFISQKLVSEGMISSSDRSIFRVVRSAQAAADVILKFYSVYHSLRYVGDRVVLRLHRPLPERMVTALAKEYREILVSGTIAQGGALSEEADEPELQHLSRLIFRFNRRDYGRLTQMIEQINTVDPPPVSTPA
jgi:uncharacterized protein (TIGR00730 family)